MQKHRSVAEMLAPKLPPVHADSPVAIIGGASLVALGTVLGAGLIAVGVIGAAVILDDDEESSPPIEVPGTPPSERRMGEKDLPPAVRGFIDREIILSAASSGQSTTSGDRAASVELAYSLDGDVRNAPSELTTFILRDQVTLRLTVTDLEKPSDLEVIFSVDTLVLSTLDVPETDGHVDASIVATQGQEELWRWSGHISQGKKPRIAAPGIGSQRVTRQSKDLLIVRNLRIPVRYSAPAPGSSAVIEVIVSVEGAGARVASQN